MADAEENQSRINGTLHAHIRSRVAMISRKDALFTAGMGAMVALLLIPLLYNLGVSTLLESNHISFALVAFLLVLVAPLGLLFAAYFLTILPLHHASATQLSRYVVIGAFNVALNAAIFNMLILMTGISKGILVTLFAVVTFIIVVTQAFFWNIFWTFRHAKPDNRTQQYVRFFAVSSVVAFINISIIHVLVNIVGAPAGIPGPLWANIALLCTIFTAVLGNFIGYRLFVFKH